MTISCVPGKTTGNSYEEDPNHTHGEGYLDPHEFVMIDANHDLLLRYTLEDVDNLPDSLEGIDGAQSTYGILQEVKDDTLVAEIDTTIQDPSILHKQKFL